MANLDDLECNIEPSQKGLTCANAPLCAKDREPHLGHAGFWAAWANQQAVSETRRENVER
jgi:hypothetical protein